MRKIMLTALLAASLTAAYAQQTKILSADKHNEYGLVYTLPTTALRIEVKATRTLSQAGPYWQYARKYIGTDHAITSDSEKWQILDVSVTPYGVADKENRYLMQLKPGALTYISVADDDMLLAINREVSSAQEVVSSVGNLSDPVNMNAFLEYVNEDFISSQSSAKRAQMLAENLMEVRDAKVALSRGTADTMPTDGRQLELMLASLARQEKSFTEAFTGAVQTDTVTRTFTYIPTSEKQDILFRMSDFAGFVDSDDYSGDPVYINVSGIVRGELPVNANGEVKKLPKDAVMYKIPGTAGVSISYKGRTLWNEDGEYGQFGVEFGLQPSLFSDRKARSYAIFNPATGALREIGEVNE